MRRFFTFALALSMILTLSSCLKEGHNSFQGNDVAIIAVDAAGLKYAKIASGGTAMFVTSSDIKKLEVGKFVHISYAWSDEQGLSKTSDGFSVYNVMSTADINEIPTTSLILENAPEVSAETTPELGLLGPTYDSSEYFNNYWIFPYMYKCKEGQKATIYFYESSEKKDTDKDTIIIDVRIKITGEATGTIDKSYSSYIAVDMEDIKRHESTLTGDADGAQKVLYVKFRYHQSGKDFITSSGFPYLFPKK